MFKVSDIITTPPPAFASELQQKVYETFEALGIPCGRVDTDPGLTMEDCQHIDEKIGVLVGATTVLSAILPSCAGVHLVMDRSVAESEWFACKDGTATCFVKFRTEDLLQKYILASGHTLTLI